MKAYLKLIGILLLPLALVIYYADSTIQIHLSGWKLSKARIQSPFTFPIKEGDGLSPALSKGEGDLSPSASLSEGTEGSATLPDTTSHRILFFGDSMVEGLLRRMNGYAFANGHDLTNVVWYSSTTEIWAKTDTLHYFLDKVKPTFAIISIGANEQFVKDVAGREAYIRQIIKELDGTPYVWIGVPAWKEDSGINDLTKRIVGRKRYYDSRDLTLQRGRDRMHPTFNAASIWMDSVAVWMASSATAHPIRLDKPTDDKRHTYKTYALQPLRN